MSRRRSGRRRERAATRGLKADCALRIKARVLAVAQVAPRVAGNGRAADAVLERLMHVAVDPERRATVLDQRLTVGAVEHIPILAFDARGLQAGRVVGYHDRPFGHASAQLAFEEGQGLAVLVEDPARTQATAWIAAVADHGVVGHHRGGLFQQRRAGVIEVRPEGAAQERDAVDLDGGVLEEVHVPDRRGPVPQMFPVTLKLVREVFVVAGDEYHGCLPGQRTDEVVHPGDVRMNVAGEHDRAGAGGDRELQAVLGTTLELEVQVARKLDLDRLCAARWLSHRLLPYPLQSVRGGGLMA